jgi:hypothetical protein
MSDEERAGNEARGENRASREPSTNPDDDKIQKTFWFAHVGIRVIQIIPSQLVRERYAIIPVFEREYPIIARSHRILYRVDGLPPLVGRLGMEQYQMHRLRRRRRPLLSFLPRPPPSLGGEQLGVLALLPTRPLAKVGHRVVVVVVRRRRRRRSVVVVTHRERREGGDSSPSSSRWVSFLSRITVAMSRRAAAGRGGNRRVVEGKGFAAASGGGAVGK